MAWSMGRLGGVPLAQAGGGTGSSTVDVLAWVGILILAVLVLAVVLPLARRKLLGRESEDAAPLGSMEEMRAMVDRGELSAEEYEQVRRAMIAKVRGEAARPD
ncbi:MAG: hypothetical protein AAFX79_05240 [Planctomycetota bacterium]